MNFNCSNLSHLRHLQIQIKKTHSFNENCSELSLFEKIVLVISIFLQILGHQPPIFECFFYHWNFFLTLGQNNFGNKIPFLLTGITHPFNVSVFHNESKESNCHLIKLLRGSSLTAFFLSALVVWNNLKL